MKTISRPEVITPPPPSYLKRGQAERGGVTFTDILLGIATFLAGWAVYIGMYAAFLTIVGD